MIAVVLLLTLGWLGYKAHRLHEFRDAFPAAAIRGLELAAGAQADTNAAAVADPSVLWSVPDSVITPAYKSAEIDQIQAGGPLFPTLALETTVGQSASGVVRFATPFTLRVAKSKVAVRGRLHTFATPDFNADGLQIRFRKRMIAGLEVEGLRPWNINEALREARAVLVALEARRAGVAGMQIANPLTYAGPGWDAPNSFPDPFVAGADRTLQLHPYRATVSVSFASQGGVQTMVRLDQGAAPTPASATSFERQLRSFRGKLDGASLSGLADTGVAYSAAFLKRAVSLPVEPVYARQRVREAIEASLDALDGAPGAVIGVELNGDLLTREATDELLGVLDRIATTNPDLELTWGRIEPARQHIRVMGRGTLKIPIVAGRVSFRLAAIAAFSAKTGGFQILPAAEELVITEVSLPGNPDLAAIIKLVNEALATAIGYGNWTAKPLDLDVPPLKFEPIDLVSAATDATPRYIQPEQLALDRVVVHATPERIRVMAALTSKAAPTAAPRRPHPGDDDMVWKDFDAAFQQAWTARLPDEPLGAAGRAYVRTDFLATYLNTTWNSADPIISARSEIPVKGSIPFIPRTDPQASCHANCDNRCCTEKCLFGVCVKLCEPTCSIACGSLERACKGILTGVNLAAEVFKGDLDLDMNVKIDAALSKTRLALAPDLSHVAFDYTIEGGADFSGHLINRPRNLSYIACLPTDLSIPFPLVGPPLHLGLPAQARQLSTDLAWSSGEDADGQATFTISGKGTTQLAGKLSPEPVVILTPTLAGLSVACPVNASAVLAGVGADLLAIIKVGAISYDPGSALVDKLLRERSGEYRLIVDGQVEQNIELPFESTTKIAPVRFAGSALRPSVAVRGGFIRVELSRDMSQDHYPGGAKVMLDLSRAALRVVMPYTLIGAEASSELAEQLRGQGEVVAARVALTATENLASGAQVDLAGSAEVELKVRVSRNEAMARLGETGLRDAIAKQWVIPINDPLGELIAIQAPVKLSCAVRFAYTVRAGDLDHAALRVISPPDPFQNCVVIGEMVAPLGLEGRALQAAKAAFDHLPDGLLKDHLPKLSPQRDGPVSAETLIGGSPLLVGLREGLRLRAQSCQEDGVVAMCLDLAFPKTTGDCTAPDQAKTFGCVLDRLRAAAPGGLGGGGRIDEDLAGDWLSHAYQCPSSGGAFPAKTGAAVCDDRDMLLFAGLLCASSLDPASDPGCALVRRAQDARGQWWRSPLRVGAANPEGDFSPALAMGLMHYALRTGDGSRLAAWRDYVLDHPADLPAGGAASVRLYRACEQGPDCILTADTWFLMKTVLAKIGAGAPADSDAAKGYGRTTAWLPYLAAATSDGYALHEVAAQIYLLQQAGADDRFVRDAATILAGRDPENPFFVYLRLGKDKRVENLARRYCPVLGAPTITDRSEWTWERSMNPAAAPWKRSMYWDCIFIANLLR